SITRTWVLGLCRGSPPSQQVKGNAGCIRAPLNVRRRERSLKEIKLRRLGRVEKPPQYAVTLALRRCRDEVGDHLRGCYLTLGVVRRDQQLQGKRSDPFPIAVPDRRRGQCEEQVCTMIGCQCSVAECIRIALKPRTPVRRRRESNHLHEPVCTL